MTGGAPRARGPTLQQVAERAGVSKSAAAFVLSGRAVERRIGAACAARVRAAAEALGYRGNYHARTLSTGRSSTIGLTMGTSVHGLMGNDFWGPIAGGVAAAARRRGYDVLMAGGSTADDALVHATQLLETGRIDALVVLSQLFGRIPPALREARQPVVTIGGGDARPSHDVSLDPAPGIAAAVAHLAALGHRMLLWIGFSRGRGVTLPERRAAFRAAARVHGLAIRELTIPELVMPEPAFLPRLDETVARFRDALAALPWPAGATAVVCYNDLVAFALQELLAERGLRVPADVSVIGFDDVLAAVASPPLTTISHRLVELGATAVEVALDLLAGRQPPAASVVPAQLVVRRSTAPPRAGA
jgi:DNA-binding LacI/PurR family transcriptional regulator